MVIIKPLLSNLTKLIPMCTLCSVAYCDTKTFTKMTFVRSYYPSIPTNLTASKSSIQPSKLSMSHGQTEITTALDRSDLTWRRPSSGWGRPARAGWSPRTRCPGAGWPAPYGPTSPSRGRTWRCTSRAPPRPVLTEAAVSWGPRGAETGPSAGGGATGQAGRRDVVRYSIPGAAGR